MTDPTAATLISIAEIESYDGPPLYLFIGISTSGSRVHEIFPRWAPLVAPSAVLKGVDLPDSAPADDFRRLVIAMRENPRVCGAVITSHKLRLFRAVGDLLDHVDPLVGITHEINSLDTRGGQVAGYARDAQSLDIVLDTTGSGTPRPTRAVTCIGAGGSAIALMLAMGLDIPATMHSGAAVARVAGRSRGPLRILGRRQAALDEIQDVRERAQLESMDVKLILAVTPDDVATHLRQTPATGIIANATGLGKLGPGSPVPDPSAFPPDTLAWDFNYRGPLTFLDQARQAGVQIEDGWDYFVAGWSAALAAITGQELTPALFEKFRAESRELHT